MFRILAKPLFLMATGISILALGLTLANVATEVAQQGGEIVSWVPLVVYALSVAFGLGFILAGGRSLYEGLRTWRDSPTVPEDIGSFHGGD